MKEYYIPILETLVELGGSAKSKVILERVYQKVQNVLTDFDMEKVPSGIEIRWRNIAGWARLAMIKEGLLSSDSPRGVWEITDKGREYLEQVRK